MKSIKLSKVAMLLVASAALYTSTQAFAQTAKGADGAGTQPPAAASAETAKIRLTRKSAAYWEVTFNNPPLNIVGPAEVRELVKILDQIEADPKVKVVVFDTAVPDYFMAHYDLLKPLKELHLLSLNISSTGVLFEADELLPASGPIELALSWPFLLDGACPLKLVMRGKVIRLVQFWSMVFAIVCRAEA